MKRNLRMSRLLILSVLLACCLWIAWNNPYAHDDWDWGLPMGMDWWLTGTLNNRYIGSFFVVCMTRSRLFKTLVMGMSMFLLPLLAAFAVLPRERRDRWFPLTLAGCAALMAMPIDSWRQTYGWVSAFANFVVLGVWSLLLILLVRRGIEPHRHNWLIAAVLFPLALTAQLFAENATVVIAMAALGLAAWSVRTGRGRPVCFSLLAGALLGLWLMFHNPLYQDLAASGQAVDGIRRLAFDAGDSPAAILAAILERFLNLILPSLFEFYPAPWLLICTGALGRVVNGRKAGRYTWAVTLSAGLFCAVFLWGAWQGAGLSQPSVFRTAGAVLMTFLIAALLCIGSGWQALWPRLALYAGAFLLAAPFAVIEEHGPRCYFSTALLLTLLGLSLASELPWGMPETAAVTLLLGGIVAFHLQIYWVMGGCDTLRLQLIQEAVEHNQSTVILPTMVRHRYYVWGLNPQSAERAERFRLYYGLPEDIQLIFLPSGSYEQWPDYNQEMMDNATIY